MTGELWRTWTSLAWIIFEDTESVWSTGVENSRHLPGLLLLLLLLLPQKDTRLFFLFFSACSENPAECEASFNGWQPVAQHVTRMKQPPKDPTADVDQDDGVMKRRLNVRADSSSLVELTERINETHCIALMCVSLLISALIGDAISFFFLRVPFIFSSFSVQSMTLLRVPKQNPHVWSS